MAVAIPVIASFAAASSAVAAAGTLAAAMGTVSGFLSIAGAALTGIGALTGEKDLQKIGGLMSLGGGLANMASAATTGGADAATSAAWSNGAGRGGDVLSAAGGDAAGATAGASGVDQAMQLAQQNASGGVSYADALGQTADGAVETGAGNMGEINSNAIWDKAGQVNQAEQARFMEANTGDLSTDPLMQGAKTIDGNTVDSIVSKVKEKFAGNAGGGGITLESIGNGFNKIGSHVKANKELYSMGGNMLNSMFGPEASAADYQKSIMERRLRNMNNPVALTIGG